MNQAIAITCQGVAKRFPLVETSQGWRVALSRGRGLPTFTALDGVSFDVPKGRFVGVMGRNGAGKSTLLRVLGGVYAPDAGHIDVSGAMSGIYELGLVGNPLLTGREYAERLLTIHGFSGADLRDMVTDIQEFSELGSRIDDAVLGYSAGMKARLFFATATAGRYDVYLLDEILSVGDQHFQAKCWRRLRDRLSRGASGVLVTHDWAAVLRMCETAHILDKGRVVYSGPAEQATRRYLYGTDARENFQEGVARWVERPPTPILARVGQDIAVRIEAEILQPAQVGCVVAVERLQTGFGWETCLLSRSVKPVGTVPGRYDVQVTIPACPLEPGRYQVNLHLVMPHPERPTSRIALDGWSWFNGDGLELLVEGDPAQAFAIPVRWDVCTTEDGLP
nr:ABC transporter ATP-binding protein [uncultured Alsobacter sp.]